MDLTPIKIRGRRKRARSPETASPVVAKLRKIARFNHAGPRASKKTPVTSGRMFSPFERLPTEIVQLIFEFSNNISLPLSSPIFAAQLSTETIYLRFAVELLYAHDCRAPCERAPTVTQMLQCRWLSGRILIAAIEGCHSRAERARLALLEEETEHEVLDLPEPPPPFDKPMERSQPSYIHLRSPVQLPQKLLQGPWTAEKTSLLYYLIWQDIGIDWNRSSRGEVATQGLQSAIQKRNRKAVASLVSPVVGVVPSAATIKAAIMDHGCDETIVYHLLQAVLRAQIMARGDGQTMTDFKFKDTSLWSWAARVRASGNAKGAWVQGVLRYCEDALIGTSVYDEAAHLDFTRACTSEAYEGMVFERIAVPLQPVRVVDEA